MLTGIHNYVFGFFTKKKSIFKLLLKQTAYVNEKEAKMITSV